LFYYKPLFALLPQEDMRDAGWVISNDCEWRVVTYFTYFIYRREKNWNPFFSWLRPSLVAARLWKGKAAVGWRQHPRRAEYRQVWRAWRRKEEMLF